MTSSAPIDQSGLNLTRMILTSLLWPACLDQHNGKQNDQRYIESHQYTHTHTHTHTSKHNYKASHLTNLHNYQYFMCMCVCVCVLPGRGGRGWSWDRPGGQTSRWCAARTKPVSHSPPARDIDILKGSHTLERERGRQRQHQAFTPMCVCVCALA